MRINPINNVYFGKKEKVNKDYGYSNNILFRYRDNNKEQKVAKQYKKELNLIGKAIKLNDQSSIELMKDCESTFTQKLERVLGRKTKVRKFKLGF